MITGNESVRRQPNVEKSDGYEASMLRKSLICNMRANKAVVDFDACTSLTVAQRRCINALSSWLASMKLYITHST